MVHPEDFLLIQVSQPVPNSVVQHQDVSGQRSHVVEGDLFKIPICATNVVLALCVILHGFGPGPRFPKLELSHSMRV